MTAHSTATRRSGAKGREKRGRPSDGVGYAVAGFLRPKGWTPRHALDQPDPLPDSGMIELDHLAVGKFLDREEAIELAADWNRDSLGKDDPGWTVPVAVGPREEGPPETMVLLDGDRGRLTQHLDHPIRVIRPTASEIKRHGRLDLDPAPVS